MSEYTVHVDTFVRDNLPPREQWPEFKFELPELQYPARMNCATELLDEVVKAGHADRTVLLTPHERWTYRQLLERANRIARVLTGDLGLVPGNRVLIRAANNPTFVACWYGVVKAGGVVVATMPLLRAREISVILHKAQVKLALCDERLGEEMEKARDLAPVCERICWFNGSGEPGAGAELESLERGKSERFDDVESARDDPVLIAFTSGTTGKPKGTIHFHRDILAMRDCFPRSVLKPREDDVFIGSPPIAFTFGLGGLVTFPMGFGASAVLLEAAPPDKLAEAIEQFKATVCFTAPTAYRRMVDALGHVDVSSLRTCVSAGEMLPLPTFEDFESHSGIKIIDGIGSTEMLHIFISAPAEKIRPGATGLPLPGYEAMVVDDDMNRLGPDQIGHLAVRGPTGCRYLADPRQTDYVREGWNVTGDAYRVDGDGYFWYQARTDDMIISSGYNIAGPEVEEALMGHDAVAECAVVGSPDPDRGHIVKAFVVLREGARESPELTKELQDFVKSSIAAYKYPRAVEYVQALPRTETGKVQRFRLRRQEAHGAGADG